MPSSSPGSSKMRDTSFVGVEGEPDPSRRLDNGAVQPGTRHRAEQDLLRRQHRLVL
jgi:hypothetical protein